MNKNANSADVRRLTRPTRKAGKSLVWTVNDVERNLYLYGKLYLFAKCILLFQHQTIKEYRFAKKGTYRFPKTSLTVHTVIMYVCTVFLSVIQYLSPLHVCCVKKFCDRADLFGAMYGTCDSYQYKICIHLVQGVQTRSAQKETLIRPSKMYF